MGLRERIIGASMGLLSIASPLYGQELPEINTRVFEADINNDGQPDGRFLRGKSDDGEITVSGSDMDYDGRFETLVVRVGDCSMYFDDLDNNGKLDYVRRNNCD